MFSFSKNNRKFFESMPVPMAYYQQVEGKISAILVTDGLCRLMRTERDDLINILNNRLFERVHPDDVGRLSTLVEIFEKEKSTYDVIYRSRYNMDEDYHFIHSIGKIQKMDDGSELAVFIYIDVTESEKEGRTLVENYNLLLKDHFYSDSVTGLPNLNFLSEYYDNMLKQIHSGGKTAVFYYFDVIGLRFYNNQYGFEKGDELLRLIAESMKEVFPNNHIVRGAEDHFIVISEYTDKKHIASTIKKLNEKIKAAAFGNTTGVQAGICVYDEDINLSTALDHAKHALKLIDSDLNKTHNYYSHETDEKYWNQRYILDAFDNALQNEWIKIYYQAIMRVRTGKAAALEALARWVDPLRGIIMPASFIPVLEKYHLLYKLDLYMVEQVCKEIPERIKLGLPIIPVSVNFSAQDFDHVDILQSLNEIFDKYQMNKRNIIIEITEQDLAKGTEEFREQIQKLRENGYHIWIDDFGSGYSSLNIISQFTTDLIKYDLEFLRHLEDNYGANRYILKAMVEVSKKLGIASLVEGLETEEQLNFLREIGCDFAQGFFYYKPESLGSIAYKIQRGNPVLPCETPEEKQKYQEEYYKRITALRGGKRDIKYDSRQ